MDNTINSSVGKGMMMKKVSAAARKTAPTSAQSRRAVLKIL
jgi:hypothetical protein